MALGVVLPEVTISCITLGVTRSGEVTGMQRLSTDGCELPSGGAVVRLATIWDGAGERKEGEIGLAIEAGDSAALSCKIVRAKVVAAEWS